MNKTPLIQAVKAWQKPCEWCPDMDRASVLHYARKLVRENSLAIPADSRKWHSSTWDYFTKGIWFTPDSSDLKLAHKKARRKGFACDHDAPMVERWRQTFPRIALQPERTRPLLP